MRLPALFATAIACSSIACSVIACSSSAPPPSNVEPAVVDRDYPALAWVPADASAAVVASRVEELVKLVREGGGFLLMLDGHYMRDADGFMRARFGASPFVADELAAAGINVGGSAALFSRGRGVTAILPVSNPGQVSEMIERHAPADGVEITRRHELDVRIWRGGELSITTAITDGWLLIHAGDPTGALGWLDEVVAVRGRGLAAEPLFARAKARAVERAAEAARRHQWPAPASAPDVVGVVRPAALLAGFSIDDPCLADAAGAAPAVLVGADVDWQHIAGFVEVELSEAAVAELAADRPAPPTTGLMDQVAAAPMAGLWTVPPKVIESIRRRWGCREFDEPVDARELRGATGIAAVAWKLDPGSPTDSVGLLRITGIAPSVLRSLLGRIPGRSLLEKTKPIDGVKLTVFGGSLGIPEVAYRVRPEETAIGSPARRVAGALSGSPAQGVPLAHLRLAPAEIANLSKLLGEAAAQLGASRAYGVKLGNRLGRYQWGELSLTAPRGVLRLVAAMELASEQ